MTTTMTTIPVSDFNTGDAVRVLRDYTHLGWPFAVTAGTEGTLGRLCRVQEGVEVWELEIGGKVLAVAHVNIERIEG